MNRLGDKVGCGNKVFQAEEMKKVKIQGQSLGVWGWELVVNIAGWPSGQGKAVGIVQGTLQFVTWKTRWKQVRDRLGMEEMMSLWAVTHQGEKGVGLAHGKGSLKLMYLGIRV